MAANSSQLRDGSGGVPLAVSLRGGEIENIHYGHIAVVHTDDRLSAWTGDPDVMTYMRSTAKLVQAIPILQSGVMEAFGLPEAAIAMMAASHRGEQPHAEMLKTMLSLTGVLEQELVFHAGLPLDLDARDVYIREGGSPRKLFHNCAGKHIGLLAACKLRGWPVNGYADPDHPIQQEIKRLIAELADVQTSGLNSGFDGCGLPVYAIPLRKLAGLYARLASPRSHDVYAEEDCMAIERITEAMNSRPELVEGSGRLASLLLRDVNCVAKSGAQGVFAIGLRYEQLGIVVKLSDGTESAWPVIVSLALRQLSEQGKIGEREAEAMCARIEETFPVEMANDAGRVIGRREAVFQLNGSST
ncbi:asparaginase [Paenibacillus kobensis]|uniref:asparaginase n=1 Tax=Paenibacillus kobensis TaxID=59841 RepID=UPI0013E3A15A|nr:asparaginase [Paenibacillus kobensis]